MLTPAAAERDRREVLSIRERLGVVYCPTCKCDTLPVNDKCAWCDTWLVLKDDPEGEAA